MEEETTLLKRELQEAAHEDAELRKAICTLQENRADVITRYDRAKSQLNMIHLKDDLFGDEALFQRLDDLSKSKKLDEKKRVFQELLEKAKDLTDIRQSACLLLYLGRFCMDRLSKIRESEDDQQQRLAFVLLLGRVLVRFPFQTSPVPKCALDTAGWQLTTWWEAWRKWIGAHLPYECHVEKLDSWDAKEPDWLTTARIDYALSVDLTQKEVPKEWRLKNLQCMMYYSVKSGTGLQELSEEGASLDIVALLLRDHSPLLSMVYVALARRCGRADSLSHVYNLEKGSDNKVWHVPKLRYLAATALVKKEFGDSTEYYWYWKELQADLDVARRLDAVIPYDLQIMMVAPYLTIRAEQSTLIQYWCAELCRLRRMDLLQMVLVKFASNNYDMLPVMFEVLFESGFNVSGGCPYWVYRCLVSQDPCDFGLSRCVLPPQFWLSYHVARAEFVLAKDLRESPEADPANLLARFGSSDLKKISLELRKFLNGRFAASDIDNAEI